MADVSDGAKQAVAEVKSGAVDASDAVRGQVSTSAEDVEGCGAGGHVAVKALTWLEKCAP